MLSIPKKWQVILYFDISGKSIEMFFYDDHFANILSKLREVHFAIDPDKVEIKEIKQ